MITETLDQKTRFITRQRIWTASPGSSYWYGGQTAMSWKHILKAHRLHDWLHPTTHTTTCRTQRRWYPRAPVPDCQVGFIIALPQPLSDSRSLWKPLRGPLRDWPLAVCDYSSVSSVDMIRVDEVHKEDILESHGVQYSPSQKWYYLSDMKPSEMLIFKAADSHMEGAGT